MSAGAVAAAAAAGRARRQIAQALREASAVSEAGAVAYHPTSHLGPRMLTRMIRRGLVHETASGALWLDEAAYAAHQAKQRRLATIAIALAFIVAAILVVIGLSLGASR